MNSSENFVNENQLQKPFVCLSEQMPALSAENVYAFIAIPNSEALKGAGGSCFTGGVQR